MSDPRDPDAVDDTGHFWRPSPLLNKVVEGGLRLFPIRPLEQEQVAELQRNTVRAFLELGASREALDAVTNECEWVVRPGRAPADAWGGEVLRGPPPQVVMYRDSPLTRLPNRRVFDIAAQLAVDHMYGHLYEYYADSDDWGEEVACRWQYRVLRQRGGVTNNVTARIVALTHRVHKQIPLTTYDDKP